MNTELLNTIGEHFLAGHCRCDSPTPILKYAWGLFEVYTKAALNIDPAHSFAPVSSYSGDSYCFPIHNGLIPPWAWRRGAQEKRGKHNATAIGKALDQAEEYWEAYDADVVARSSLDPDGTEIEKNDGCGCFFSIWQGHATLDYRTILGKGFVHYTNRVREKLAGLPPEQDEKSRDLYQALSVVVEGMERLIRRNVQECDRIAAATEGHGAARVRRLQQAFEQMLVGPPEDFYQALQYVHFFNAVDGFDNVGRLDQYTYPFYRPDVRRGLVDGEGAVALLAELLDIWGAHNHWQVVIGGQNADGADASNELTRLIMDARRMVNRPHPSLSLRVSSRSPDELLAKAFELLKDGLGQPALYNDDLYVRTLEGIGVPRDDAVEFVFGGCSETHIAGKGAIRDAFLNMAKALEELLKGSSVSFDGQNLQVGTVDPETFEGFDSFLEAYKRQVESVLDGFVHYRNRVQQIVASVQPALIRSLFISDGLDRGVSNSEGGVEYNHGMVDVYGIPNIANSLFVIKKLVFEERTVSMRELLHALRRNFEGYEDMRRLCLKQHKYGNDCDDVDDLARDVADHIFGHIQTHSLWNGGGYYGFCASAPGFHMAAGQTMGATPDGRLAGTPLANSMGPVQGTDVNGPTAMLKSVTKIDLSKAIGSPVVNISLTRKMLDSENHGTIISLVRTYFRRGGMQLQFTVVDRETLRDAMEHPERHGNLLVRVSGYCARFVDLPRQFQEEVAERVVH